jgi:hypothetical protein
MGRIGEIAGKRKEHPKEQNENVTVMTQLDLSIVTVPEMALRCVHFQNNDSLGLKQG